MFLQISKETKKITVYMWHLQKEHYKVCKNDIELKIQNTKKNKEKTERKKTSFPKDQAEMQTYINPY